MKILRYNICTIVDGIEIISPVEMGWNEINEETAKKEANNGEYTIVDDGQPEPEVVETADDVLNALLGVNV